MFQKLQYETTKISEGKENWPQKWKVLENVQNLNEKKICLSDQFLTPFILRPETTYSKPNILPKKKMYQLWIQKILLMCFLEVKMLKSGIFFILNFEISCIFHFWGRFPPPSDYFGVKYCNFWKHNIQMSQCHGKNDIFCSSYGAFWNEY